MSVQTSVSFTPAVAIPGMVRGTAAERTRAAAVAVQNGLFVCMGSADEKCKLPTASTDITGRLGLGIARDNVARDPNFPPGGTAGFVYQVGDSVAIAYRGEIAVAVEEAVAPGDPVYVRYATGTGSQKGAFRASADSSSAALLPGARYITTASAGGIAIVDLNMPQ